MIELLNTKDENIASRIVELQIQAYMEEAKLINFYEIPALKESVGDIQQCDEIFYGWWEGDDLAGIISYKIENGVLDIHRVAVKPVYFRRGIAKGLLQYIEGMHKCRKIIVQTGEGNYPAKLLYESFGFRQKGEIEVTEGLIMAVFEKEA
ncbi:MAG: GNAT family N-acetyltransferase [Bacillota bacterium]|nr:GNAT family N-acetyltransferase [Bacillota bacterium]